jgi:hypothetical protein
MIGRFEELLAHIAREERGLAASSLFLKFSVLSFLRKKLEPKPGQNTTSMRKIYLIQEKKLLKKKTH